MGSRSLSLSADSPGEAGESAMCGERGYGEFVHIYIHTSVHKQVFLGASCVILSKLHNLSEPPFLNIKNNVNSICCIGSF